MQAVVRCVENWIVLWKAIHSLCFSRTKVYEGEAFVEAGGAGGEGHKW